MKRIVLIFGLISGAISSAMMFLTLPFSDHGAAGYVIGYTTIFLSMLLIFFGIRQYRENRGGTITFGRAFAVGILIALISTACYIVSWEILYYNFMPDFLDKYAAHEVAQMKQKGASDAAVAAKMKEMQQFKKLYDNPFTNAAVTFVEPFPVGLIVTLASAAILRKREGTAGAPAGAVVA